MISPVIFSTRVLTTLNALPADQRDTMAAALTGEFLLGTDVSQSLSGEEVLVYAIIRQYVRQDMAHARRMESANAIA